MISTTGRTRRNRLTRVYREIWWLEMQVFLDWIVSQVWLGRLGFLVRVDWPGCVDLLDFRDNVRLPNPNSRQTKLNWMDKLTTTTTIPGPTRLHGMTSLTGPASVTSITRKTRLTRIISLAGLTRIDTLTRPARLRNGKTRRYISGRTNWMYGPSWGVKCDKMVNPPGSLTDRLIGDMRLTGR